MCMYACRVKSCWIFGRVGHVRMPVCVYISIYFDDVCVFVCKTQSCLDVYAYLSTWDVLIRFWHIKMLAPHT
jgi:hypothetical protein